MTQAQPAETIRKRLEAIELAVAAVLKDGSEAALACLRTELLGILVCFGRDPGVAAGADDLYAAACAIVGDSLVGCQPLARKQRLLRDAANRFRARIAGASARNGADEIESFEPDTPDMAGVAAAHAARRALDRIAGGPWYRKGPV